MTLTLVYCCETNIIQLCLHTQRATETVESGIQLAALMIITVTRYIYMECFCIIFDAVNIMWTHMSSKVRLSVD